MYDTKVTWIVSVILSLIAPLAAISQTSADAVVDLGLQLTLFTELKGDETLQLKAPEPGKESKATPTIADVREIPEDLLEFSRGQVSLSVILDVEGKPIPGKSLAIFSAGSKLTIIGPTHVAGRLIHEGVVEYVGNNKKDQVETQLGEGTIFQELNEAGQAVGFKYVVQADGQFKPLDTQ